MAKRSKVYKVPNLTVDNIVTKNIDGKEMILLITRAKEPFKGKFAFPGGFVDYGENPEKACIRELEEECSIIGTDPKLVCVAGEPSRDPRKHIVSIVYHVNVKDSAEIKAADDAETA